MEHNLLNLPNTTVDDVPSELRFSASRLRSHETCSLKHHYFYRKNYRAPFTADYLTLGTIIHELIELYYTRGLNPTQSWLEVKDQFPNKIWLMSKKWLQIKSFNQNFLNTNRLPVNEFGWTIVEVVLFS